MSEFAKGKLKINDRGDDVLRIFCKDKIIAFLGWDDGFNENRPGAEANAAELVKRWNCHEELEQRDTIMVEALAEIKALAAGDSNPEQPQSIKEIVNSCIEELAALAAAENK